MDAADDTAEITRIEVCRAKAIVEADAAELNLITDDVYVHVDSSGRLRGKGEFLEGVASDGGRFVRYDLIENQVVLFGDAALVTGLFENTFQTGNGEQISKRARHTRFYIRRGAGWRNVSHHASAIA